MAAVQGLVHEDSAGKPTLARSLKHPEGPMFTAVAETHGETRADVLKFNDGPGFSVEHDVPLNGEWSDLTAQFEFVGEMPEFEVILHDIHVL
jgi:hypothetical protein